MCCCEVCEGLRVATAKTAVRVWLWNGVQDGASGSMRMGREGRADGAREGGSGCFCPIGYMCSVTQLKVDVGFTRTEQTYM